MENEKGYIKIITDSTEIKVSYQLKPNTLDRIFKIVERVTSKKLLKRLFSQSRGVKGKQ